MFPPNAVVRVVGCVVERPGPIVRGLGVLNARDPALPGVFEPAVVNQFGAEVLNQGRFLGPTVGTGSLEEVVDEVRDAIVPHPLDVNVEI